MDSHPKWRLRARAALEAYFRERSFPRLTLGLLVTVAGFAGFLISHYLLYHGFQKMWQRYPLAVITGYIVFLIQLRLWVEIERSRYNPNEVIITTDTPVEKVEMTILDRYQRGDHSWIDWLDYTGLDFSEGCFVGCLFLIVIGLLSSAITTLVSFFITGPGFLAEVFLDAVVVTVFYRHLKTAAKEHWLGTAVKGTWRSVLLTAASLSLIGAGLDVLAPNSHSIGPALKEIFSAYTPK